MYTPKDVSKVEATRSSIREAWRGADEVLANLISDATDAEHVAHEAKGRIMEGADPKPVLAWVLTQITGQETVL